MACLPLVERELRVALRKQRPVQGRLKVAALAVGGSVLFLLLGALSGGRSLGTTLEQILCLVGLYCVLRVPVVTASVLAEERQNQTLGLLFLSGLGAWEVFAGKFLSSALVAFTSLLAIFPMLALPFLIGGVSLNIFVATICALPALMLLALAFSLMASVLTRDDGTAVVLTFVLLAMLCLLTPVIYVAQTHFAPGIRPSLWWWRLSPAYGPHLIWNSFGSRFSGREWAEFWQNTGMTLVWAGLALVGTALALNRVWRERETRDNNTAWDERWHDFLHGGHASRRRLASSWLEVNPFVWLAGRDRQPVMLGWLVVCGVVLVWLVCWAAWPTTWPSVQNFFVTTTLANSVLAWLTRHQAAREIGQPRRDGTYELLLTTPLETRDMVWGMLDAVRGQFRALTTFVLLLNILMMLGGLLIRRWNVASLIVYFVVWLVLLNWTWSISRRQVGLLRAMWISLNCGRPAHAVWRSSGLNTWSWIWILFNLQSLGRQFQQFPTGSRGEILLVVALIVVLFMTWLGRLFLGEAAYVRDLKWDPQTSAWISPRPFLDRPAAKSASRLISEFREIVREPLPDPSDPRFKKWNVRERFPWGWQMVQQQLHERLARR